ncbi:7059_t:CDS:2 [Gigaspora rosea]|nr:7059_t:CDS:2 [Gigaspora rosea]
MTDNTKLHSRFGYSANLGCIIGSTFSYDQTQVEHYNKVELILQSIISNNAIAKQVRLYLLQVNTFTKVSTSLLEMAGQLSIHIISVGADGAISEFNAQKHLITKNTGLTKNFRHYVATYNQVLDMYEQDNSVLYKKDVINCDRQDDGASYRLFCSSLLNQIMNSNNSESIHYGLFVYLFVIGELVDAYQNRTILHLERARMVMMAYFFLTIWRTYILLDRLSNSNYISPEKNFLATQTFNILTSLAESLLHGSEGCEHFFGLCRQINNDFTFSDLLYMVPKVSYIYKAYMNGTLNEAIKDKTSGVGYITHYNTGTLAETINILHQWPSDDDLLCAVHEGYQQAWDLAKVLSMVNCDDKLFDCLNTFEKQSNLLDNENTENDFSDDFNGLSQNNELSDSYAISAVASTLADFNTINIRDDDIENDLRDARFELAFLVSDTNSLNNYDLRVYEKFYTGVIEAETLDVPYLVNL